MDSCSFVPQFNKKSLNMTELSTTIKKSIYDRSVEW